MPEGPEVARVCGWIEDEMIGHRITGVTILYPKLIDNLPAGEFAHDLENQKIEHIRRKGKFIIIETDDYAWIVHLRMEGHLEWDDPDADEKIRKHIHARFELDDGRIVDYRDTRKFGRMWLYPKQEDFNGYECLKNLGPDAFSQDFNAQDLYSRIHKKRIPIKNSILDQSVVCGIGNIYASEILYAARIHPNRKSNEVSLEECKRIVKETKRILSQALDQGGTTIRTFSSNGHAGNFQNELQVYEKDGQECPICHEPIVKEVIGQRSTYLCPKCQK